MNSKLYWILGGVLSIGLLVYGADKLYQKYQQAVATAASQQAHDAHTQGQQSASQGATDVQNATTHEQSAATHGQAAAGSGAQAQQLDPKIIALQAEVARLRKVAAEHASQAGSPSLPAIPPGQPSTDLVPLVASLSSLNDALTLQNSALKKANGELILQVGDQGKAIVDLHSAVDKYKDAYAKEYQSHTLDNIAHEASLAALKHKNFMTRVGDISISAGVGLGVGLLTGKR